jgi:hypothetical protein
VRQCREFGLNKTSFLADLDGGGSDEASVLQREVDKASVLRSTEAELAV